MPQECARPGISVRLATREHRGVQGPIDPLSSDYPVTSREDVAGVLLALATHYENHPDEWENADLGSYLQAMAAWLRDADGSYRNVRGTGMPEPPGWQVLADLLRAGRVYE